MKTYCRFCRIIYLTFSPRAYENFNLLLQYLTAYELMVTACRGWSHKIVKLLWVLRSKRTLIGADGTTRKTRYIDFRWERVAFTGRCYIWLTAQVWVILPHLFLINSWWSLTQNLHYFVDFTVQWHVICNSSKCRLSNQIKLQGAQDFLKKIPWHSQVSHNNLRENPIFLFFSPEKTSIWISKRLRKIQGINKYLFSM